ncbi:MAG: Crp/Fnr family transcriptional regulator [Deltaproteobacteria bacterium]|nr:Crp/Fnr family transcriptional regulator [Deltaproteobacteria bacterium]
MREDSLPYMKQVSLFDGFSEGEMQLLSQVFRVRRFAAGEALAREGEAAPSFFVVVAGIVSVVKEVAPRVRQRLATVGRNRMLGQIPLVDGGRRPTTLEAAAPVIVLECGRDDFERLFNANSPFAYKVLDFVVLDLSRRLRQTNKLLEELLANPGRTLSMVYDAFIEVGKVAHETGEFTAASLR